HRGQMAGGQRTVALSGGLAAVLRRRRLLHPAGRPSRPRAEVFSRSESPPGRRKGRLILSRPGSKKVCPSRPSKIAQQRIGEDEHLLPVGGMLLKHSASEPSGGVAQR